MKPKSSLEAVSGSKLCSAVFSVEHSVVALFPLSDLCMTHLENISPSNALDNLWFQILFDIIHECQYKKTTGVFFVNEEQCVQG